MNRASPASAAKANTQAETAATPASSDLPAAYSPAILPDAGRSRSVSLSRAAASPPDETLQDLGSGHRAMSPTIDGADESADLETGVGETADPETGDIVRADSVGLASTISGAVLTCISSEVKRMASEWSTACGVSIEDAVFLAIAATLELAGLARMLQREDINEDPDTWLEGIIQRAEQHELDLSTWPLLPNGKPGSRRVAAQWQKFWSTGLACQSPSEVLERRLPDLLMKWLVPMSRHKVRSLRHAATVAALAIAEAFGSHYITLGKLRALYRRQLQAASAVFPQQVEKLERELREVTKQADELSRARTKLLEEVAMYRKYDVSEAIRLHTVIEMDRLMRQETALLTETKWSLRVYLMMQDPSAEVRLKTISIVQNWYSNLSRKPRALQEHLKSFAVRSLKHLVERCSDVDSRVAVAAIRCLGSMELNVSKGSTEQPLLNDVEFQHVVGMVIGSQSHEVRSEAALFVNAHVFTDPGICDVAMPVRRRSKSTAIADVEEGEDPSHADGHATGDADQDQQPDATIGQDAAGYFEKSHTALAMVVDYLENFVGEHLRLTERAVNAFWGRAPCLTHWRTMVNMCMVGEHGADFKHCPEPIAPKQRLIVLYIMEAAVRRASEDLRRGEMAGVQATSTALNNACAQIIPDLPRLFQICRPNDEQMVLVSHVAKMLIQYATSNQDEQNLVNIMNAPFMIQELRNVILQERWQVDTLTNCVDIFLHLVSSFEEAKDSFCKMSEMLNASCRQLTQSFMGLTTKVVHVEDLKVTMGKFIAIGNRALDMTHGKTEMYFDFLELLKRRADWLHGAESWNSERPSGVPDAELAMQLMEAALVSLTWYCELVYNAHDTHDMIGEVCADNVKQFRACLPEAAAGLQKTLVMLLRNGHEHSGIRFMAFSCFTTFCQSAFGLSDRVSLEAGAQAPKPGDPVAKVAVKEEHVQALSEYLEDLLKDCSSPESEVLLPFNTDGVRLASQGVQPAPSMHTLTSTRFLLNCWMQAFRHADSPEKRSAADMQSLSAILGISAAEERQLFAVLACRMIADSTVEAIRAGPLGHVLLMQCDRHRPKALRDVAFSFKKRLRERARASDHHAVHFFHMQKSVLFRAFACSGTEMATSLSAEFVKHWGLLGRGPPGTEGAAFQVLKDSVHACITADRTLLPLLDAFSHWLKNDEFIVESRRLELIECIRVRCTEVGVDHRNEVHIIQFLQRMQLRISASSGGAGDQSHTPSVRIDFSTTTAAADVSLPASERSSREHQSHSQLDVSSTTRAAAALSLSTSAMEAHVSAPGASPSQGQLSNSQLRHTLLDSSTKAASPAARGVEISAKDSDSPPHSSRKRLHSEQRMPLDVSAATPIAAAKAATPASTLPDTTQESPSRAPDFQGGSSSKRRRDASMEVSPPVKVSTSPLTPESQSAAEASHIQNSHSRSAASQAGSSRKRGRDVSMDAALPADDSAAPSAPVSESAAEASHSPAPPSQHTSSGKRTPDVDALEPVRHRSSGKQTPDVDASMATPPQPPVSTPQAATTSTHLQTSTSSRRLTGKTKPSDAS